MKGLITLIGVMLLVGIVIGFGYLICVGLITLIFWALEMGGINIDFSIWIGGGILYILWTLFGRSN